MAPVKHALSEHDVVVLPEPVGLRIAGPVMAKTIRRRYLTFPGRLTRSARRLTLHLPARWPWADQFQAALTRLRRSPPPADQAQPRPARHDPTHPNTASHRGGRRRAPHRPRAAFPRCSTTPTDADSAQLRAAALIRSP